MQQGMSAFECYERGLVLKQVGIFDAALEDFQRAATDPRFAGKAQTQIALCLRSTGRLEGAVVAFHRALESATFSPKERVHILYLLGQTLESLGRYAETLEIYRLIRSEDAGFQDVDYRIKYLCSDRRGSLPFRSPDSRTWVGGILRVCEQLKPHLVSLLNQTWKSLTRFAGTLETYRRVRTTCSGLQCSSPTPSGRSVPVRRGKTDKRRHARIAVHMRSQFSSKSRIVVGEGELQDLSPWGCRITSPVGVPIGTELECCIFPQDELNPFTVDEATVRWIRPREFGLAFTKLRPGVQRQIAQLCRTRAPLG
jgi:hypothetical protein